MVVKFLTIFVDILTEEEISKKLGISKQAVNKAKNHAFQKIRQEYQKIEVMC